MTIEQLMNNEAFNAKLKETKDLEEVAELFREQGIETSAEALKPLLALGSTNSELDENALENVAGGISGKWPWNSAQDRANRWEIASWLCRSMRYW